MSDSIRVAVVGSGFGERVIVPCLDAVDGLSVVARVSRSADAEQAQGPRIYRTVDDLLDADAADLVCVAAPPTVHEDMCMKILAAGKHVLCEKPLSVDTASAQRMAEAATGHDQLALVDHQLRFDPALSRLRDLVSQDAIGRVLYAHITYLTGTRFDPANPTWHWWFDKSSGGGQLFALGSHMIDLVRFCIGEPESVSSELFTAFPRRRDADEKLHDVTADEAAFLQLRLKTGAPVMVSVSSVDAVDGVMNIRISGDQGALVYDGGGSIQVYDSRGQQKIEDIHDPLAGVPVVGANRWRRALVRLGAAIVSELRGVASSPIATFDDGLKCQAVLDAARLSAEEGVRADCNIRTKNCVGE